MHGRGFLISATWTAPATTFSNAHSVLFAGKSVDDLLLNVSTNYKFVGYTVLETYGLHDIFRTTTDVAAGIENFGAHLDRQLAALATGTPEQPTQQQVPQ